METIQNKVAKFMTDWKWHSNIELSKIWGWRFGGHLFELKKKWYLFDKKWKEKWDKNYTEYFKLIKEPVDIIVVKWWKIVKQEVVVNEIDKYLWNTNIKNTNYKWYKALYNKLFNF